MLEEGHYFANINGLASYKEGQLKNMSLLVKGITLLTVVPKESNLSLTPVLEQTANLQGVRRTEQHTELRHECGISDTPTMGNTLGRTA